ncbi:hypothetical protein [Methylicorpusculum sp.]|uniref:hypothetical protein n=1 Tax=Methylicorpusculum sp. TaxID=2713644 RepID=UPI00272FFF72|nr:hypothetical protein [Methylicorpusculum sp.]MDP2180665.1 hypothetical protein [Methylicorpusculum sp.]MDP3530410.1 hypothetical protein [Methylicorpusculum sp.]
MQTLKQYSRISKIPLSHVLHVLAISGFDCDQYTEIDSCIGKILSRAYRGRDLESIKKELLSIRKLGYVEDKLKSEKKRKAIVASEERIKQRRLQVAQKKEEEILKKNKNEANLFKLIDLFNSILPLNIKNQRKTYSFRNFYDEFVKNGLDGNNLYSALRESLFQEELKNYEYYLYRVSTLEKSVYKYIKSKQYTPCIIEIIRFISGLFLIRYNVLKSGKENDYKKAMSFSNYFFILDLLVNINELELAKGNYSDPH